MCKLAAFTQELPLLFDESASLITPTAFGTFRVLHQEGTGVLGPVFRSYDPSRSRLAAVKVFQLDLRPDGVVALANALRRLVRTSPDHPSVVRLIDAGVEGSRAFLAMEYHAGPTLDAVIKESAPAPLGDVLDVLGPIAGALDAAVLAGLHHGAFHPRDVILAATGAPVLTGLGIRSAFEAAGVPLPAVDRRGYRCSGASGAPIEARADLVSLAAVVHQWLTGKRPSPAGEQGGAFASGLLPEQRVQVRRVLSTALSDTSSARFASASEFVAALRSIGAREFVDLPQSVGERAPGDDRMLDEGRRPSSPARGPIELVDGRWGRGRPAPARAWTVLPWVAAAMVGLTIGSLSGAWIVRLRTTVLSPQIAAVAPPPAYSDAIVSPAPPARAPGPSMDSLNVDARPARATGRLTVRSEPAGAMVTVDGRLFGATPLVLKDLPLGVHDVRIARPGHLPRTERVTIASGLASRTLNVALEAGAVAPPAFGALRVESRPRGVRVLVDGRLVGQAPLRAPELRPGSHRLTLEMPGYRTVTTPVFIEAGAARAIRVTMEAGQ